MASLLHILRRALATGLTCAFFAPLLGATHVHTVDHDGATKHIETAHGPHLPAVCDGDYRMASKGPRSPAAAIPVEVPDFPGGPSPVREVSAVVEPHPPPQRARSSLRSRAPPA